MYTIKPIQTLPFNLNSASDPTLDPLPNAQNLPNREVEDVVAQMGQAAIAGTPVRALDPARLWETLPEEEKGVLAHLAHSTEELSTPAHLAMIGKSAKAIGSLIGKGLIAGTPLGVLQIIDPLLKDFVGEASMHFESSASVAEGGPKTFQFNFGMSGSVKKLQAGH